MTGIVSVYFDGAIVQAVHASISGGSLTVKEAYTFPLDELDDYLSGRREKSFIICSNPLSFHQDVIYLPPAASRQYDKLVRAEAHRLHPELTAYSTFHTTVGQATIDTKLFNKIAVFSYADDFLSSFISVFNHHGKVISQIYAAPYSIFKLIASTCLNNAEQTRIFIASLPGEKLLLTGEHNELEFIRKIPSSDATLIPSDVQNINMTLDYCFQTLRIHPVEAVMLNQTTIPAEQFPLLSVPLRLSAAPLLANVPDHMIAEYLAPLAAVRHYAESPRNGTIMPADYAIFLTHKKLYTFFAISLFVLTLLLCGYLMAQWMIISELKSNIAKTRTELSGSANEIASFRKLDAEANLLKQPLDLINRNNTLLNPATALAALSLPTTTGYAIKEIAVQGGVGFLAVRIEGIIHTAGFSETQTTFEGIIEQLTSTPGYSVSSSSVDIKLKTFSIQARYNGSGKQGK